MLMVALLHSTRSVRIVAYHRSPNHALHRIAALLRFGIKPKVHGWAARGELRAFELAQKAVTLDDILPLAHGILGRVYQFKNQHDQAIAEGERAVALDPNDPEGYVHLAAVLGPAGRAEDAIESAKKAMRLNPHYPPRYILALAAAYHQAWLNEEAIAAMKRFLVYNPNLPFAHMLLACSYSDLGREAEARAEVAELLRINPNFSMEVWKKNQWFRDPAESERHINNLHKAGLK